MEIKAHRNAKNTTQFNNSQTHFLEVIADKLAFLFPSFLNYWDFLRYSVALDCWSMEYWYWSMEYWYWSME